MKILEISHNIETNRDGRWIDSNYRVFDTDDSIFESSPQDEFCKWHKVSVADNAHEAQKALFEQIRRDETQDVRWAHSVTQDQIEGFLAEEDSDYLPSYVHRWTGRKSNPTDEETAEFIRFASELTETALLQ